MNLALKCDKSEPSRPLCEMIQHRDRVLYGAVCAEVRHQIVCVDHWVQAADKNLQLDARSRHVF